MDHSKFEDLRKKAEDALEKKDPSKRLSLEIDELIHELEVYQIELEMQNENLIKTQIQLQKSQEDYKELYDFAPVAYFTLDNNWVIKRANLMGFTLLGIPRKFLINSALVRFVAPDFRKTFYDHSKEVEENKLHTHCEIEFLSHEKNPLFVSLDSVMVLGEDGSKEIKTIVTDITDRKDAELKLADSLKEKETLLKEIHHRVKNNLLVISSLLNLQSEYIKDKASLEFFRECQSRANAMALIHERLYQSTDLHQIDFSEYIQTIVRDLFNTYDYKSDKIKLILDLEPITVDINIAVPCGLITNELMSNAIKHAFPGDTNGEIKIKLSQNDDSIILTVKDNGIGLPVDIDIENTSSLGLKLVNSLVSQIDGEIRINSNKGTEFTIIFPEAMISP